MAYPNLIYQILYIGWRPYGSLSWDEKNLKSDVVSNKKILVSFEKKWIVPQRQIRLLLLRQVLFGGMHSLFPHNYSLPWVVPDWQGNWSAGF